MEVVDAAARPAPCVWAAQLATVLVLWQSISQVDDPLTALRAALAHMCARGPALPLAALVVAVLACLTLVETRPVSLNSADATASQQQRLEQVEHLRRLAASSTKTSAAAAGGAAAAVAAQAKVSVASAAAASSSHAAAGSAAPPGTRYTYWQIPPSPPPPPPSPPGNGRVVVDSVTVVAHSVVQQIASHFFFTNGGDSITVPVLEFTGCADGAMWGDGHLRGSAAAPDCMHA